MAIGYLENLGGRAVGDGVVEGDGWRADCRETTVSVGPSLTLTEVTVTFEGDPKRLEELLPEFRQKAMRAGG